MKVKNAGDIWTQWQRMTKRAIRFHCKIDPTGKEPKAVAKLNALYDRAKAACEKVLAKLK